MSFARMPEMIGTSPAGVEWVNYTRNGDTAETFEARSDAMRERLNVLKARRDDRPVKISGLTPTQAWLIEEECQRSATILIEAGKTWVEATRGQLDEIAEGIEFCHDDDDEIRFFIEGGCDRDLTEAQIEFGVAARKKSVKKLVAKIRKAIR